MSANAETHHYIKNILQAIISYTNTSIVNTSASGDKQAGPAGIKKLNHFIHVLSSVQDLVFAMNPLNFKGDIRADQVLAKAAGIATDDNDLVEETFPEILCPVKRTTNLALIMIEAISCVKNNCAGPIKLNFTQDEEGLYHLMVQSKTSTEKSIKLDTLNAELKLAGLLLKSDLNSELKIEVTNGIKISCSFTISS